MNFLRQVGRLLVLGSLAGVAVYGCYPSTPDPTPPPPLVPSTIGVLESQSLGAQGRVLVLTDGRSVDDVEDPDNRRMNATPAAGDLILASAIAPKFVDVLEPINNIGSGCWEAWQNPVAWDMGPTIRFSDGIELPKAADFQAPASTMVYGHLGWASPPNGLRWSFCANSSGQIEWATPP